MLFSFHYLATSFFLTVWSRHVMWVLLTYYIFQTIYYFAAAPTDTTLFWGWQTLVSVIGSLAGYFVGFRPLFVYNKVLSYFYFIVSLAAYIGAQVFYAKFPPFPGVPAGQEGLGVTLTFLLTILIIFCVWYGVSREHLRRTTWHFFGVWLLLSSLGILLMFVALTGLDEIWVTLISGGAMLLFAAILYLIRLRRIHHILKPILKQ